MKRIKNKFKHKNYIFVLIRDFPLFTLSGLFSGLAATVFLYSLFFVTSFREANLYFIYFLPLAGLTVGLLYYYFGQDVSKGNHLILEEIHNPKKVIPLRMTPLIYIGTLLTHLCGGSAGREGTAVQMGASLSDQLSQLFKLSNSKRRTLLIAGTGAAFGAAIGTPWAGVFFGMEVIYIGRIHLSSFVECLIASFIAFGVTKLLHAPHTHFEALTIEHYDFISFLYVLVAAFSFGIMARLFLNFSHWNEQIISKIKIFHPLKPFFFGLLIVLLYKVEGSGQYAGLGMPVIIKYMDATADIQIPLLKMLFTLLTINSGFKGGEFVPLVFIGTTLGSALSFVLPLKVTVLACLGFASVFGAAANTPLTCTIMAIELFGLPMAPYAAVSCFLSYYVSGHLGLYKNQKVVKSKKDQIHSLFTLLKYKK